MNAKRLGLFTLSGLVVANMIGAGVFTTSGFALSDLGSPGLVLLTWAIGGAIAVCGAISYGYLVRLNPQSGGEYQFLTHNIHPLAGFIAGWVSLMAGFTGAIAYAAMTLESYLVGTQAQGIVPENSIASLVIVVAMLAHGIRLGLGASTQNVAVVLKLVLIGGFISFALITQSPASWQGAETAAQNEPVAFSIYVFALSLMWVSFSFSGFNAASYIASEVEDGASRVPRALLYGTVLTTIFYLLLNTVFVLIPPFDAVASQEDVAAAAAQYIAGDIMAMLVRGIIVVALFTSVSAMIMIGPRVYAKMADDGLMPKQLKFTGEVPRTAIIMQSVLAIAVVWISTLRELLSYMGFMLGLSTAATVLSLFVVTARNPDWKKRLPGFPWPPALYVFFTLVIAALAAVQEPRQLVAAVLTLLFGSGLYFLVGGSMQGIPGSAEKNE